MSLTRCKYCLFFILPGIYFLAWFVQTELLLKDDVAWLMHLARLVAGGGTYIKDFFEINPPLIIYLYMPTVAIMKTFSTSDAFALRLYIFMLATVSLYLCSYLVLRTSSERGFTAGLFLIMALAAVFLLLPVNEFGQREHLLIILTFPYLLLTAYRLEGGSSGTIFAIVIGLMAGFGFAIKPFFMTTFILVECYYFFLQRKHGRRLFNLWSKPETIAAMTLFLGYGLFLVLVYKNYFQLVVPLAVQFYYSGFGYAWDAILLNEPLFYLGSIFLLYYLLFPDKAFQPFGSIFILALASSIFFYAVQRIPWYYHLLPALAIGIFLSAFLLYLFFKNYSIFLASFLGLLLFLFPVYFTVNIYLDAAAEKKAFSNLIFYLRQAEQGKLAYFLSARRSYMVFAFDRKNEKNAARLQYLTWMHGYLRGLKSIAVEPYFNTMMTQDLIKNKPQLVFVDTDTYWSTTGFRSLDCLGILKRNSEFRQAWSSYHYVQSIENRPFYKFDIYERQ